MTDNQERHLQQLKDAAVALIDRKYRAGAIEHPGELSDMDIMKLLEEARNENTDQSTYLTTLEQKLSAAIVSGFIVIGHIPYRLEPIVRVPDPTPLHSSDAVGATLSPLFRNQREAIMDEILSNHRTSGSWVPTGVKLVPTDPVTERADGHSALVVDTETGEVKKVDLHPETNNRPPEGKKPLSTPGSTDREGERKATRRREVTGQCDDCFEEFGSGTCIRPFHPAFRGAGGVQTPSGKYTSRLGPDGLPK